MQLSGYGQTLYLFFRWKRGSRIIPGMKNKNLNLKIQNLPDCDSQKTQRRSLLTRQLDRASSGRQHYSGDRQTSFPAAKETDRQSGTQKRTPLSHVDERTAERLTVAGYTMQDDVLRQFGNRLATRDVLEALVLVVNFFNDSYARHINKVQELSGASTGAIFARLQRLTALYAHINTTGRAKDSTDKFYRKIKTLYLKFLSGADATGFDLDVEDGGQLLLKDIVAENSMLYQRFLQVKAKSIRPQNQKFQADRKDYTDKIASQSSLLEYTCMRLQQQRGTNAKLRRQVVELQCSIVHSARTPQKFIGRPINSSHVRQTKENSDQFIFASPAKTLERTQTAFLQLLDELELLPATVHYPAVSWSKRHKYTRNDDESKEIRNYIRMSINQQVTMMADKQRVMQEQLQSIVGTSSEGRLAIEERKHSCSRIEANVGNKETQYQNIRQHHEKEITYVINDMRSVEQQVQWLARSAGVSDVHIIEQVRTSQNDLNRSLAREKSEIQSLLLHALDLLMEHKQQSQGMFFRCENITSL